jgi:endonuclease IV
MPLIGRHVTGGQEMLKGLRQTIVEGGSAAQVYVGSPMSYTVSTFTPRQLHNIRAYTSDIYTVVHGSYFLQATETIEERWNLSAQGTVDTLEVAEAIGAHAVVIHPGTQKNSDYMQHAAEWLMEVTRRYHGPVKLLLETMAGRTSLGNEIDELEQLCKLSSTLGICLDTTHSWSAGCLFSEIAADFEYRSVDLVHFNVPNKEISRRCYQDRHSVDFDNCAWDYREIVKLWSAARHLPCILEGTPNPLNDYKLLRSWL